MAMKLVQRTPRRGGRSTLAGMGIIALILFGVVMPFPSAHGQQNKVLIGLTAEFGHKSSTSARAIEMGILTAIDEINQNGGVLGGRLLDLVVRDDRSIPARGVKNFEEFAKIKDLVAVFGGKFSPVMIEMAAKAENTHTILFDPWAAANSIIPIPSTGSFIFRLSLRDEWALERMIDFARHSGWKKLALILPNNDWGRSSEESAKNSIKDFSDTTIVSTSWYNWGDTNVGVKYGTLLNESPDAILMVANEWEGSELAKTALGFPSHLRKPIISHWGIAGGDFVGLIGPRLNELDLTVVQTFSFYGRDDEKALSVFDRARRLFNVKEYADIPAQVGFAHAYDLTHVLALAIEQAGSLNQDTIRDELEKVYAYEGLTRHFDRVFSSESHEALSKEDVFIGRFHENGMIELEQPTGR